MVGQGAGRAADLVERDALTEHPVDLVRRVDGRRREHLVVDGDPARGLQQLDLRPARLGVEVASRGSRAVSPARPRPAPSAAPAGSACSTRGAACGSRSPAAAVPSAVVSVVDSADRLCGPAPYGSGWTTDVGQLRAGQHGVAELVVRRGCEVDGHAQAVREPRGHVGAAAEHPAALDLLQRDDVGVLRLDGRARCPPGRPRSAGETP